MKFNMGMTDRVIRFFIAVFFGLIYYMNLLPGIWDEVVLILGFIMLFTAIVGICPLYSLLGLTTLSNKEKKEEKTA